MTAAAALALVQEAIDDTPTESSWVGPVLFIIVLVIALVIAIRKLRD